MTLIWTLTLSADVQLLFEGVKELKLASRRNSRDVTMIFDVAVAGGRLTPGQRLQDVESCFRVTAGSETAGHHR